MRVNVDKLTNERIELSLQKRPMHPKVRKKVFLIQKPKI
jgi:hypothetical protein